MNILISNDDGIHAPGINALAEALGALGNVTVVAPHRERSTASHSLTLHKPLRIQKLGENRFSCSGSPADCMYMGIHHLSSHKPDLIVSGINEGANLGTDIHYSGTVAAAREGALMGIKGYAVSLVRADHLSGGLKNESFRWEEAAQVAAKVIEKTHTQAFPENTLLNMNIPNLSREQIKSVKVCPQGIRHYTTDVTQRTDPRGKEYFWIGGGYEGFKKGEECDCDAVDAHHVSLTPLTINCTHREFLEQLRAIEI